jgi:glucose/arabinose dehydrogenase
MKSTYAEGFERPLGLIFQGGDLLVADLNGVWRLPYTDGALKAEGREQVTEPGALGSKEGHYHRIIALHPDGEYIFVTVGSASNVAEDPSPHATIQRFKLDGSEQITFAAGLRNPIGTSFYPGTNELYTVVNERDMYGDALVPDYFTRVQEGDFFGWPYAYMGPNPDPEFGDKRPDLVATTKVPDVLFDAHSAPVGLIFYDGEQFPKEYRGDAFVALHGSFNKTNPTGYKVVRIHFEDGRPLPWYENFATGFWTGGTEPPVLMGRPAGLLVMPDGSLLIGDDWNDTIWRVSYAGDESREGRDR